MHESTRLTSLIESVANDQSSRRSFMWHLAAAGLTAPMATMLLLQAGVSQAQSSPGLQGARRGGGGALKALWWQGSTMLNPHLAFGSKDKEASRIFYEPLASWDSDGNLVPVLAEEIPSRDNGGLQADGRSVVWRLKRGVSWHDGQAFTADDCVFNWEYARDPATRAATAPAYSDMRVEKLDAHTVRIVFGKPTPFWADAFVGSAGMIIPRHLFAPYTGARSREAPNNLLPVGTGPYRFVDFRPGDMLRGSLNSSYHQPNRPFFDSIEVKGGGDAVSAARAVLQTGEYDYAWNLSVEDDVLKRMEASGKGRVHFIPTGNIEFVQFNFSDPWNEVDGERSSIKSTHFAFGDPAVRQAMVLLCDRKNIQDQVYGRAGVATSHFINHPSRFRSPNTRAEFNIDKANALLDGAGWRRGSDGMREKGGRKLKLVFQTSVNATRQKTQAMIKQVCGSAGIDIELKSVSASVFFSNDLASPDTYGKFYADMQMFTTTMLQPDPERFMDQYLTREVSSRLNKWQGRNISRYSSAEYDGLHRAAELEGDPLRRAALFIRMNDILINEHVVLPVVSRPKMSAMSLRMVASLSGWDLDFSTLHSWHREGEGFDLAAAPGSTVVAAAAVAPTFSAPPAEAVPRPASPSPASEPAQARQAPSIPAGRRVALVIGNSAYPDAPLRNPVNDAQDISEALRQVGFTVIALKDQTRSQMTQAVLRFGKAAEGADAALFFFAGHGLQIRGRNYLLPVGQTFNEEAEVEADAVEVGTVLGRLEEAGPRVGLLVLDACRTTLLARNTRSATRGLARIDAPSGALIAFAAQPGAVALDGTGRNGVYTGSLLKHMKTPGLTVEQVFKRVRADVENATGQRQSPREESSLKGDDFYFLR